ncbi:MAG: hypothetical protein EU536_04800 [Promethearchaeota archaeon]|nr:MAG: hypothetical protein EU536_04800 [Candidatus Lokiarchaeota archaeon]
MPEKRMLSMKRGCIHPICLLITIVYRSIMNWILDSCTLIYLIKARLFQQFMKYLNDPVIIDTSVYEEVITKGKERNYPDASEAERRLEQYNIPIIPIDIDPELKYFIDPGEASCYMLAKQGGICLTSDERAYKKIKGRKTMVMKIDDFYFQLYLAKKIAEEEFFSILHELEQVYAIHPKITNFYYQRLKREKKNDARDLNSFKERRIGPIKSNSKE